MNDTQATWASDTRAFVDVVDNLGPAVQAYFVRRAPADAEDLLAATWLAAWTSRATYDSSRGSTRAWMFGVARNVLNRHWQKQTSTPLLGEGPSLDSHASANPWPEVDARLDAAALGAPLRAALRDLAPVEREMLLLIAWEQLTPTEAAAVVGISAATARTRLFRARTRMRAALFNEGTGGRDDPPDVRAPAPVAHLLTHRQHAHPLVDQSELRRTR